MTFIRWRGGKVNLIPQLSELFPDIYSINGYIEPFIGGGSVFFFLMENYGGALDKKPIYLSDINPELINCYRVVRDKVNELISLLEKHQKSNNEKYFYSIRDVYPPGNGLNNIEKASMFIYLCNTCFGGEWRVNSEGKFNKAYGGQDNARVYNGKELLEYSKLLKGVKLNVMSFENIVNIKNIGGYFVYCCLPGTKIRMRDERLLNIEQIKIGDISFMGGNVVNTMNRNYIGDVYEFETMGIYDNLCVTEEHPIAIIRQEYIHEFKNKKMSKFKNQQILDLLNIQFVMAKNINVGDFLLVPCYPENVSSIKTVKIGEIDIKCDEDFGWICGFWLAEGHIVHWDNNKNVYDAKRVLEIKKGKQTTLFDLDSGDIDVLMYECKYESSRNLVYSCGELDFEHGFIDRLDKWYIHHFKCAGKVGQSDSINNPNTYQIRYYVEDMSKFLYENFGELAENKKISNEILNYPLEFQKGLLRGWTDGDGGIYGDEKNRCKITGTSVSERLALDMYSIALRLGLRPLLKQRGKKGKQTIIGIECKVNLKWDVYFSSQDDIKYLYPDCHDFGNSQTRSKRRIITKGNKKFILTPITSILKRGYNGPVYNLTTENNVYVANYILNHNCDPPYFDIGNRNFTQYSQDGFHLSKRVLIRPTFQKLDELGCKIMMSNSSKTYLDKEFKGYNIIRLQTKRMRGVALDKVTKDKIEDAERLEEMIVTNYEPTKKQRTIDEAWG